MVGIRGTPAGVKVRSQRTPLIKSPFRDDGAWVAGFERRSFVSIVIAHIQVSDAEPLIFGDVFWTVLVTVIVKSAGALAITVTTPGLTHVALPESLIPAIEPSEVAHVSPSACVSIRLEWSVKVPVAV